VHLPTDINTIVGIIGAALIFFGFYRTSIGKWSGKSLWFELDNFIGAALLVIYQLQLKAYVSVVMNAVWGLVALVGVSSIGQRHHWNWQRMNGQKRARRSKK
jgi:hypothetical protein